MTDIREIEKMMDMFEKYGLTELSIKDDDFRITLKKENIVQSVSPAHVQVERPVVRSAPVKDTKPEERSGLREIKSPIHGNFYRSPSPGAKPYVEIGQNIEEGQVVCIVESMKLMNEIKATFSGKVADILIEDGKPVGKDEPIILVE